MIKTKRIRRINYRNFVVLGLGIFVAMFLFIFLAQKFGKIEESTNAANLANFQAGYIISDYQMTDYGSMSEADIQNWLRSKNSCGNNNYNYYLQLSNSSSYRWHFENGHFICLSEEHFGDRDGEIGFQYGETAAHIIWQAAQDYKINPKVLLVLLQKETGLITDPIPNDWDYRRATGYGCPDTAACSEKYYGFKNQVRNAAYLFRIVMDGNSSYYPIGNNNVRYSPNPDCGSSMVYIKNLATSALYRYTPYQPNAGALAAGYGTAYCGAYGNRNFYSYFEDWFGNITWDGWPPLATVLTNNRAAGAGTDLALYYQAHVERYGWLGWVNGGEMAGTAGYGARMEALQLKLANDESGIEYRAHIQNIGWTDYEEDGAIVGTTGSGLRMEAIQIRLAENMANRYDVYYRTHVEGFGWMDWKKDDEISGTVGEGKRIEAIQVKIVKKKLNNGPEYSVHVQNIGWMNVVRSGELAGTTGKALRVEALKMELPKSIDGNISYRTHVQNYGWMDWEKDGELAGTTGEALRVEAVEIKLGGEAAKKYDIYYRVHVQDYGWMGWEKNGETAGTVGEGKRVEAVQVELVKK